MRYRTIGVAGLTIVIGLVIGIRGCSISHRPRDGAASDDGAAGPAPARVGRPSSHDGPNSTHSPHVAVRDAADATPIAGARVTLQKRRQREAASRFESLADGLLPLTHLDAGDWLAVASGRGYVDASLQFTCGPACAETHVILMTRLPTILGTVRDSAENPLAGAHLQLRRRSPLESPDARIDTLPRVSMGSIGGATTDAAGRFVITNVPADTPLSLQCWHERGVRVASVDAIGAGETREISISLERASGLKGRLSETTLVGGRAAIDLFRITAGGHLIQEGRAVMQLPDLEFAFSPVLAGDKLVAAQVRRSDTFEIVFVRASVPEGDVADVGTLTAGTSELRVVIEPAAPGLAGRSADLLVQCVGSGHAHRLMPIHVQAPVGRTTILRGIPAGPAILTAAIISMDGSGHDESGGYAERSLDFDGVAADVALRMERRATARARATALFPRSSSSSEIRAHWIVWRDGDIITTSWRAPPGVNRFGTPLLASGRYRIEVFGGGVAAAREVELLDREVDVEIDEWQPSAALTGVVRRADGSVPARAKVWMRIVDRSGTPHVVDEQSVDEGGRFQFLAMPLNATVEIVAVDGDDESGVVSVDCTRGASGVLLELPSTK